MDTVLAGISGVEPRRFLPFVRDGGRYRVRWAHGTLPGDPLAASGGAEIFLLDGQRATYLEAKRAVATPRLESELDPRVERLARDFVARALTLQHPGSFPAGALARLSLDDLAMQVQEDFALLSLSRDRDWLSYLHVCLPSGWKPEARIGLCFERVHAPVPGSEMARIRSASARLLRTRLERGRIEERFVWGLQTDSALDRHPDRSRRAPFRGEIWLRVERQLLIPLREVSAFLFVIRPYVYPVDGLSVREIGLLRSAIASMEPATLEYKGIARDRHAILDHLDRLARHP